jgi:hypothetical protein
VIAGAIFAVSQGLAAARGEPLVLYDAHAYWSAAALDDPYRSTINGGFDAVGGLYEYKYPPPLAQVMAPLHFIPWPIFATLWAFMLFCVVLFLAGRWAPLALLFPPVLGELWLGNINLLIALAIVLCFRASATWSFVLLTKITPGIGLAWFLVRREWKPLLIALLVTAAIAAVSYALAPSLWSDWWLAIQTQTGATVATPRQAVPVSLPVRLAIALVLVAWGARTERRWLVPIAAALAVPFAWWNVFSICVGSISLADPRRRWAADGRRKAPTTKTTISP